MLNEGEKPMMKVAGQATSDVINGLKSSPLMLGLVILNLIAIGVAGYILDRASTQRNQILHALLKACVPGIATPIQ